MGTLPERETLLAIQAVPLCMVFTVSSVAKLLDPPGTAAILRSFGFVSKKWALPFALSLGIGELALAFSILLLPAAWAAVLTLVTLSAFTAFLVFNLARGVKMDCGCFGKGFPSSISWWTLARNLIVAIPAAFLLDGGSRNWVGLITVRSAIPILTMATLEGAAILLVIANVSLTAEIGRTDVESRGVRGLE